MTSSNYINSQYHLPPISNNSLQNGLSLASIEGNAFSKIPNGNILINESIKQKESAYMENGNT